MAMTLLPQIFTLFPAWSCSAIPFRATSARDPCIVLDDRAIKIGDKVG
jgi:hypothetical protein